MVQGICAFPFMQISSSPLLGEWNGFSKLTFSTLLEEINSLYFGSFCSLQIIFIFYFFLSFRGIMTSV